MKKTKLTELLSSFSSNEIKKFNVFLKSPYFNNKQHFIELFAGISKYHPDYGNSKLTEETAFAAAYPGKVYSYTIFKNTLSDLYELAKTFLSMEFISEEKLVMKNYFLLNLFRRSNIKELIDKEINIAEQVYEKERLNFDYFEYNYLFKKSICKYFSINDHDKLNESSDSETDSFYSMVLYNILTYGLFFEAKAVDSKTGGDSEKLFDIIESIYKIDNLRRPVTEILYKVYMLLRTDDEKYYFEIMEMLKDEDSFLNRDSKLWVYQPLEAFLIRRIRNGEKKFYRPQFELYKHVLDSGVLGNDYAFIHGKLIMSVEPAVKVKEFEWIEQKIEQYKELGPKEIREDYYNFNMAKVLQAKGENDKALGLLNKINMEIFLLKSMVRHMQMKIYYELDYIELAKSQIDAYRHYIAREKDFSADYKESVTNFLKLYNKLLDAKMDRSQNRLEDLEYEVNNSSNVVLREWLIEKTAELKKGAN